MGCDGGTIPKRHELVKTKKKEEQKDKNATLIAKWKYCALSNEPLLEPIVACELGRLYKKEAVIEYLLNKQTEKKNEMSHVKGLKDIHSLTLTPNPSWEAKTKSAEKGDAYIDDQNAKYICPIAGVEMNGRHKFCYLRTCGCVLSCRALREIHDKTCALCSKQYSDVDDVIILNGDEQEVALLRQKLEARRSAKRSDRRRKKESLKNGIANGISDYRPAGGHDNKICDGPSTSKQKQQNGKYVKQLEVDSAVHGAKHKIAEEKIYKSESFKSLFTSHSSAKRSKNSQAHWVTYNPYH